MNNKKILIISKLEKFENENSSNRFFFLKYLESKEKILLCDDNSNQVLKTWIQQNEKPDIIVYYFLSRGPSWTTINIPDFVQTTNAFRIPRVMIFEDSHYISIMTNCYYKYQFHWFIQIGHTNNVINQLKIKNIKYSIWNHYIDTNKFRFHYTNEKEYDFLFYGYVDSNIYPLRTKIYQALKELQQSHTNTNINIKIIEHKTYDKQKELLPNQEELSKLLSKSRFSFSTSSKYDLFVKKYMEIPLSGATIIGNIPQNHLYQRLLKNNMIEIKPNTPVVEIKKILLNAFYGKYSLIEQNIEKIAETIKARYNYEQGYNDFINIINTLMNDKYLIYKTGKNNNVIFSFK